MGNGGLASVGKILALAGFFSVVFGGFLYSLASPGELWVTFSDQVVGQVALPTTVLLFCPQSLEQHC